MIRARLFLLLLPTLFSFLNVNAQTETITGTVLSSNNNAIPGVTVELKGTQNGTTTNQNGQYSINNVPKDAVLIFTSVSYTSQEIPIDGRNEIDVILIPNVSSLDQVVVVGYGTQAKRDVTGSISSIDMSKSQGLPNVNITQSFSGVAGVQFEGSGRPGQGGSILIRGQNSLSASNNPLIVLDGIIFNGDLSDINPNDIQSMDILKDASAAAIYGSRAANGVILITSKKGKTEKPTISLNAFYGLSDFSNKVKLLSPERYIQRRLDWRAQEGMESDPSKITNYLSQTESENYKNGISHNPWDIISQQGKISSYDMNISGKSKFTNYFISASLSNEHGLIYNDNQKRTTVRASIDQRITDWLNIGINATFIHRDLSGQNADISDAYRNSPYGTYYYPDGKPTRYPVSDEQASTNAMWAALLTQNSEIYDNLFSNFHLQIDVPFVKGLSYRLNYAPNYRWNHNYNFFEQDAHQTINTTNASKFNEHDFDWVLENIVTYKKAIGQSNFDLTLLFGRNHQDMESTIANANLLSLDALGYNNLSLGSILTNSSAAQSSEGISSMARLNYQYKHKYLVTLTARRDGSSVFAANNKYATFPSAAIGWIASEEPFLANSRLIDMLKVRISYGAVGNQAITPYQSLSLSGLQRYVYGDGGPSSTGVVTSTMGNEDLKWETTYTSDAAIDFSLFKGVLSGTIEYYNSNTHNLIVRRTIPAMNGYKSILTNIGQTNNKGIEITLNSLNLQLNRFKWSTTATFSHNKNAIVHLFKTDLNGDGKEDDVVANSWFIGHPINSYYDYVFDGIYQEADKDIPQGSEPGFVRFKDLNGDKKINADDRTIVGSGVNPKYQISLSNTFSYKKLSLTVFVNAMDNWIAPFDLINPLVPGRALNQLDAGWWTEQNKSDTRPSLTYANPLQANWYLSRDFIRIKDVSLSYDFQGLDLGNVKLSALRLYLSAKNLYTFTRWLGSDPESGGSYTSNQGSDELFPMPRTFSFGINVSF
ncbi:MAG: TonB-dependent receptor [Ginsengibacter sp.]